MAASGFHSLERRPPLPLRRSRQPVWAAPSLRLLMGSPGLPGCPGHPRSGSCFSHKNRGPPWKSECPSLGLHSQWGLGLPPSPALPACRLEQDLKLEVIRKVSWLWQFRQQGTGALTASVFTLSCVTLGRSLLSLDLPFVLL